MKITREYLRKVIKEAIEAEGVKVSVSDDPRDSSWLEDSEEYSFKLGRQAFASFREPNPGKLERFFRRIAQKPNGSYTLYHLDTNKFKDGFIDNFRQHRRSSPEIYTPEMLNAAEQTNISVMAEKVKQKILRDYPDAAKKPQKRKQIGTRGGERGGFTEPVYSDEMEDFDV